MSSVIEQEVKFQGVKALDLYELYMNEEMHGAALGAPAKIDRAVGGQFSAFNGGLTGRIYDLVPGRVIVQSWRAQPWREEDPDSVVILNFTDEEGGSVRINLVHANIPEHARAIVNADAWTDRYWRPWRLYLAKSAGLR